MKSKLFITATLTATIMTSLSIHPQAKEIPDTSGLYPMTAIVTELDSEDDIIYVTTATGNEFTFFGCEDYYIGDYVSLIMWDNGTSSVYDDEILEVRYSGFYE